MTSMRILDYCSTASVIGRRAADDLWDRATPAGIDMDHLGDQEAQEHRAAEREAQDAKCSACKHGCLE